MIIGLTGGIACGKSTVSEYLAEKYGVSIVCADKIAHDALKIGTPVYNSVVELFGAEILAPGGQIDRASLGRMVFADKQKLGQLNALSHPYIIEKCQEEIRRARLQNDIVMLDCALLIEMGMQKYVDAVWVVTAGKRLQIDRAMQRGMTAQDAILRIQSQTDEDTRLRYADVVIDNSKSIRSLYADLDKLYIALQGRERRDDK